MTKLSNYPNGFPQGVNIQGIPVLNTYSGSVFWVDSNTGSNGNKGTHSRPFATIDFAIGRCTANKGDLIMVRENHAETVTGAAAVAADVAGITIRGLGVGGQRPRLLLDAGTAVSVAVSAADVTIENIVLAAGHADIVLAVDVTGTDCNLRSIEFVENTAGENFLTPIKATGADGTADGLTIIECKNLTLDTAALEFLEITGDLERLTMLYNNHFADAGTASPLILSAGTKVLEYADVGWNKVQHAMTAGDLMINNGGSTNSGMFYNNYCGNLDVTGGQTAGACTGWQFYENLMTSTYVASGALEPVADTPLS